ncbi:MAG: DUF2344 domain-containing protein [Propionibacteriales bacterium]|nr:DUF2344 domain-containing protein [Propionibacteriales bacterium]
MVTDVPEQPIQQPPPVQRLRVRYAKRGRLRFTSHRDFGRALERALRRAGIPMALSSGYTPHLRVSYAGASPTGAASEAEYLEIALREECDPSDVLQRLDRALPNGLDVLDVVPAGPGALADLLEASHWRISLPEVSLLTARSAVERFLEQSRVPVKRMTKKGEREFDARAAVIRLSAVAGDDAEEAETETEVARCAILDLVLRHGTPSVRPDDVLTGLRETAGLVPPVPPLQTRIAQGPLHTETGQVGDPFAVHRDSPQEEAMTATGEAAPPMSET